MLANVYSVVEEEENQETPKEKEKDESQIQINDVTIFSAVLDLTNVE